MNKVSLVKNTISQKELLDLSKWILSAPKLTKGTLTDKFEKEWSEWLGVDTSVFVSSGSSANLAAFYALKLNGKLKNNRVIMPAVSWATTIAPAIQLGFEPVLCDCNMNNYGLDLDMLKELIEKHDPGIIVTVNVLGFANNYFEILELCERNNIVLIEDSCEAVGTTYAGKKVGTFGHISTFSFYYGHHISTIEGGMVCTNDEDLNTIIRSIRCHGWDRDLAPHKQESLRKQHAVGEFKSLYTFYYPGFNMRPTDLQAFLGLTQLKNLSNNVSIRDRNFRLYHNHDFYENKPKLCNKEIISNFAYPVITENIDSLVLDLKEAAIECRPLICGSISRQPFWYERYGKRTMRNADIIHDKGLYVPNNQNMTEDEVHMVIGVLRKHFQRSNRKK